MHPNRRSTDHQEAAATNGEQAQLYTLPREQLMELRHANRDQRARIVELEGIVLAQAAQIAVADTAHRDEIAVLKHEKRQAREDHERAIVGIRLAANRRADELQAAIADVDRHLSERRNDRRVQKSPVALAELDAVQALMPLPF